MTLVPALSGTSVHCEEDRGVGTQKQEKSITINNTVYYWKKVIYTLQPAITFLCFFLCGCLSELLKSGVTWWLHFEKIGQVLLLQLR